MATMWRDTQESIVSLRNVPIEHGKPASGTMFRMLYQRIRQNGVTFQEAVGYRRRPRGMVSSDFSGEGMSRTNYVL